MRPAAVDLLIRCDFRSKGGGDVVLAGHYEAALSAAGLRAALLPITPANVRRSRGVVHVFNVDRLIEFSATSRRLAMSSNTGMVISPIHHPPDRVEFFENRVRSGALKVIARAGRGAVGRERIKHLIRERSIRGIPEAALADPIRVIGSALASARLVTLQAEAERRAVETTFGVSIAHNSRVVPNGVDIDASVDVLADRDIDVLVVGRVEERKNQLHLATALAGTGWKVVFVGAPNPRNPRYVDHFGRVVEESENMTHVGHVSHAALRELMARSRVCASASYFEVVSLAELESVGYGCQLVASDASYMPEYLNGTARFLDPCAGSGAWLDAISAARQGGVNRDGMAHVRSSFSWPLAYQCLRDAYASAGLLSGAA